MDVAHVAVDVAGGRQDVDQRILDVIDVALERDPRPPRTGHAGSASVA